jgi:twinkle protein
MERHIQTILEKVELKPFAQHGRYTKRISREDVQEVLKIIDAHFHFIVPKEDLLTVETILEKARIAIFRHGVKGVVIDPWNELDHLYEGKTEAQYLSEKLTKIRRFARENAARVWIVAHPKNLSKDLDGVYRPPTMYEISGGAHWRNEADNGICIHRPDSQSHIAEIIIQKIRFKEVGKVGTTLFRYCADTGTYSDAEDRTENN